MESLPILVPLIGGLLGLFTCITCCTTHNVRREQRLLGERVAQVEVQINALGSRGYTTQPPPIRPAQPQYVLQPYAFPTYPYATAPSPQQQPHPTKYTV